MTIENLLERFDSRLSADGGGSAIDPKEIESLRSKAFEEGYASGWEDAQTADSESRKRIEAEFERNIQNLIFTYTEAVDCVRGELKNFVSAIVEGLFPELVPELTREHVRNELLKIADDMLEAPIEIVTASDSKPLLDDLLERDFSIPINLIEDATLAPRQVYIRIAEREIEVNVAPLVEALRTQLNAVADTDQERTRHAG